MDNEIIDIAESIYGSEMNRVDTCIEEINEAENSLLLSESYIPILDDDAENVNTDDIDDEELDNYLSDEDIIDNDEVDDLDDIDIDNDELFDNEGILN